MEAADWGPILGQVGVAVLSGGLISALVTYYQNARSEKLQAQEAEHARLRTTFAEAFEAYADYKEFPYLIRRRRADRPEEERARITTELNAVQSRLSYFRAWTMFESPSVGKEYGTLLDEMRRVVGGAMREAWNDDPADGDRGMNISSKIIDLSGLSSHEDLYMTAVADRLKSLTPRRLRRR